MQHSSILMFLSGFFMLQIAIALAASWFLSKWFPLYQLRYVRILYWIITFASYIAIFYRRIIVSTDYGAFTGVVMFLLNVSFVWSFGLLAMLVGFIFISLVKLSGMLWQFVKKKKTPTTSDKDSLDMSRRNFLKTTCIAVPYLSFGLAAEGVINAHSKIVFTRHQLTLPDLSPIFDGFKIAQITDTHIGPYFKMDKLKRVVDMIQGEKPHLLVITGDFIDDVSLLPPTFEILNPLAAKLPYGAYFCWGNHEYHRNNFNIIKKYFDQSPVIVLRNESKLIDKADSPLYLAGVDYPFAGRDEQKKALLRQKYLTRALKEIPSNAITILISHHSDFIEEAFAADIPLTLTGHTHGGQAAIFGKSLLPVSYKYMLGMYSHKNLHAYVSTGTGHWMPFRFNCPAEIAVFTLRS